MLGAQHLLALATLDDGGFVVPHTIPPSKRDVEPITYSWCHGPTGTSHLFAALAHAGVTEVGGLEVHDLRRRCLRSVLNSGIPQRLHPGLWDNDGRCCGTAGVGDVLLDVAQDPPLLPPGTSWMQGAAGIAAFLLRLARVTDDGLDAPVVDRPDEWWAVPAGVRCSTAPTSFLDAI